MDKSNLWLENVLREAGIRKSLLIHGNVSDICRNPKTGKYEPLLKALADNLRDKGFDAIVVWDRVNGIDETRTSPKNIVDELRQRCVTNKGQENARQATKEETYDTGEANDTEATPGNSLREPDDFFAVVLHAMTHATPKKIAFFIDWSDYLFGNANALSEVERNYLVILGKAIRNAETSLSSADIEKPSNLILLVANSLATIPPSYYQNNPLVKHISIPLPGRGEREAFVKDLLPALKLKKNLQPKDAPFADFIDMLDDFTLRDIQQLIKLSRQQKESLGPERLVNLYKYGEKTSPWEELSREKLQQIDTILQKRVKGQEEAIDKVKQVIIRAYTGLAGLQHSNKQKKPKGILFFVGPTGVGKTELAKALAEFLFGDENACIRFDMSEFNHEHSDQRLVGAPPGYVGYEEGGQLTNAIREKPFCVLLFDEIEKAHGKILDKFLQILEDGRLTDGKGETVSFAESIIIFTSNIGAADIPVGSEPKETQKAFREKVTGHFVNTLKRPELLNRIGDNIVVFRHIQSDEFLMEIAKAKLSHLFHFIQEKYRMTLYFVNEEKALRTLVSKVNRANGGRGVLNELEPRILNPLAIFIFENASYFAPGKKIKIVQAGNTADFDFELEE